MSKVFSAVPGAPVELTPGDDAPPPRSLAQVSLEIDRLVEEREQILAAIGYVKTDQGGYPADYEERALARFQTRSPDGSRFVPPFNNGELKAYNTPTSTVLVTAETRFINFDVGGLAFGYDAKFAAKILARHLGKPC